MTLQINHLLILNDNKYKKWDTLTSSWKTINNGTLVEENYIQGNTISEITALTSDEWNMLSGDVFIYSFNNFDVSTLLFIEEIEPYSVYDYISDTPEVLVYTESEEDIIVSTRTEPFTIYDEFVDENGEPGEVEVLYYTDDENAKGAELSVTANWSPLDELEGDVEVVTWTNEEDASLQLNIEGIHQFEIVTQVNWIDVTNLIGVSILTNEVQAPFVIQKDGDLAYYTYYQGYFYEVSLNEYQIATYGLNNVSIKNITQSEWLNFLAGSTKIKFTYLFSNRIIHTISASEALDVIHTASKIVVLRDIFATTPEVSKFEIEVIEYTMNGYLKEIERLNAINFAKLQFKTNALLNSKRYAMHNLIVDTFEEDSMLTTVGSGSLKTIVLPVTHETVEDGFISRSVVNVKEIRDIY